MNIKKGDIVKVIRGKYQGKTSKVTQIFPDKNKILVDGVNVVKKATRPKKQGDKGGLIDKTLPFDRSKVMIVCKKCQQATRIGHKISKSGDKVRICRKCGEEL